MRLWWGQKVAKYLNKKIMFDLNCFLFKKKKRSGHNLLTHEILVYANNQGKILILYENKSKIMKLKYK